MNSKGYATLESYKSHLYNKHNDLVKNQKKVPENSTHDIKGVPLM